MQGKGLCRGVYGTLLTGRFGEDNAEEVLIDSDEVCCGRSLKLSASQTLHVVGGWVNSMQYNVGVQCNAM